MTERSSLYVEGVDDQHVVRHLLLKHGIACPLPDDLDNADISPLVPEIRAAGDREKVLDAMRFVKFSTGHSVGFVIDADEVASNRWQAVRNRLEDLGLSTPRAMPADGFVVDVPDSNVRVGVWLMPDNVSPGALEDFLRALIDEEDALLPFADATTVQAKARGADFPESKRKKAVLSAWLAWQRDPGRRYGTAVNARYFNPEGTVAFEFVEWFNRLFGTAALTGSKPRSR